MARQLQLRRGTTAQHATFTGAVGEVTIDTDKDALVVHDGVLAGGVTAARESVVTTHTGNTNNPHGVTKTQIGLENVDNTSDADKVVASAGKLTTTRTISLSGDATGSVSFDGSTNVDVVVAVGNDTHTHAFGNLTGKPTTLAGYSIGDAYTKAEADALHNSLAVASAGQSVSYFLDNVITPGGNYALTNSPDGDTETTIQKIAVAANTPYFMERYISDPIGGTKIDGGLWLFRTYASVSSDVGTSEIISRVNKRTIKSGTVTITGTGTSRTITSSDPIFVFEDANSSILNATLIETPTETFWISAFTSATQVTATTDNSGYINETSVVTYMYYKLFEATTGDINGNTAKLYETKSIQPSFNIVPTDSILIAYFAITTSTNKTLTLYKGGTVNYSHIVTPIVYRHNSLKGLNEGEFQHLTAAQLAKINAISGTNTGDQDLSGKADVATTLLGYGITDAYTKTEINTSLDLKVDKSSGKGLSTEDYTSIEKSKLNGIAENANNYSLPVATDTTLGGVKAGANITIDAGGFISASASGGADARIEKFIENPDSTSGIITVPKVIASGETITIPSGRVAILPNVQIDGVLNVEGEVFIPSGATLGDLDAQLALKAPLVNPAFTNPTATTQAAQDNSTKVATTAYVDGKMVLGTAVASTSGTSIDFTGIPSWVKKVTVLFNGVSTNGTSNILVQIGTSSGIESTAYQNFNTLNIAAGVAGISVTNGFGLTVGGGNMTASNLHSGKVEVCNITANTYIADGNIGTASGRYGTTGSKILSGILDRIRITTVNGTDTFDAGQINIMYEG